MPPIIIRAYVLLYELWNRYIIYIIIIKHRHFEFEKAIEVLMHYPYHKEELDFKEQ